LELLRLSWANLGLDDCTLVTPLNLQSQSSPLTSTSPRIVHCWGTKLPPWRYSI